MFSCELYKISNNTFSYRTPLVAARSRSSHLKAFIYLKLQKTVYEVVNLLQCCEIPTCKWTKKLFHTPSFMRFDFIFSEYVTITSSKEALKVCEHIFFFWKCNRKVVLLVIYLFFYDSCKSTFFMLNYSIRFSWGFSWVQFLSNKLEFFVSCNNIKDYKAIM